MFVAGPSATTRLVVVVILSIVMLNVEHRERHLERLRAAISTIVYPLYYLADLPLQISDYFSETFASRNTLLDENERLKKENIRFLARLQKLDALEMENMRLRSLLGSSLKVGDHILVSELMRVDLDPNRHQVIIDKGSRAGIYAGQPALDARAVMGQVIHVTPWSSTVLLITDSSHSLPVQINRTGLRTVADGTGEIDELRLPHLPNDADVRVGDLLVTSGLGGRFPAGYPVGVVREIDANPSSHVTEATAIPSAHLDRAREVLLVWTDTLAQDVEEDQEQSTEDDLPQSPQEEAN